MPRRYRWLSGDASVAAVEGYGSKHSMAEVDKKQTRDAFREGLVVRALGRPCGSNPYPPTSDESALWEKGWRSVDENVLPAEAGQRIKLVPEFMPGARVNAPRRGLLKLPESFAFLAAALSMCCAFSLSKF